MPTIKLLLFKIALTKVCVICKLSAVEDVCVFGLFFCVYASERRGAIRYSVFARCKIQELSFCIFTVKDISGTGCQLEILNHFISDKLKSGKSYTLLVSPKLLTNKNIELKNFSISAHLVWINQNKNILRLGLKFLNTGSKDFQNWLEFIETSFLRKGSIKKPLI